MASFKYLIFVALVALSVYSVVAEEAPKSEEQAVAEASRVKKHAYFGSPLAYSSYSSSAYPYAYSAYPYSSYPYSYPTSYSSAYTAYPSAYSAAYPSYSYGKYWPSTGYYPSYRSAYPYYHY